MSSDPDCIFCKIIGGKAPAEFVYQDDQVVAFMDINPVTPGHLLVVPKFHAADLTHVPDTFASRILPAAGRLITALKQSGLRCDAVNLFMANGVAAGQSVFHTHLHVIPRFSGDGFGLRLHTGVVRQISTPLSEQAAVIRSALETMND